jgi:hypothetical protein
VHEKECPKYVAVKTKLNIAKEFVEKFVVVMEFTKK